MQNQLLSSETEAEITSYVVSSGPEATAAMETSPDVQAVSELLAPAQRKIRRRNFNTSVAIVLFALVFRSSRRWARLHYGTHNLHAISHAPYFYPLSSVVVLFIIYTLFFMPTYLDTETLARIGGTKAISPLLDSLCRNASLKHQKSVTHALTILLPQLQATDAALLTPRHRQTLNAILNQSSLPGWISGTDSLAVLAILKAYEQVGDAKSIPAVERLVNQKPRNESQRTIQRAAAECLPLLQAHVNGINTTQTLLRASMPNTVAPDTLLRAATREINTPKDELLRAPTPPDTLPSP